MAAVQLAVPISRMAAELDDRLRDEVARIRVYQSPECVALRLRSMRADQHPVSPALVDRLYHQLVQVVDNVIALLVMNSQVGGYVFQNRFFAQVKTDHRGH